MTGVPRMEVACIADGAYWPHAGAMVHSLLSHHEPSTVALYVLHGERRTAPDMDRMRELCARFDGPVRFLEVPAARVAGFPGVWFPRAVWYRVLLPELLPELDRILYLDSDLLVRAPLWDLWHRPLGDHAVAAVTNPLHRPLRDYPARIGVAPARYFNTGVLLMNLRRMRAIQIAGTLEAVAQAHPEHTCPDQDALSVVLGEDRVPLDPRWNFQTPLFDLRPGAVPFFDRAALAAARADPAIVHYSGPFKPWHSLDRYPYAETYRNHARQTPWGLPALEGRSRTNALLKRLPATWVWRYFLAYAWLHRVVKPQLRPLVRLVRGSRK